MNIFSWIRKSKFGSSIHYQITPRKVKYDWADTPIDWIPQQPFASYFINQVHMILPEGEFWMCRMFNRVLPQIKDDKLREDIHAFIRQEAMHAKAHVTAHQEYLEQRQIDPSRNLAVMDFVFKNLLSDQPLGYQLPKILERQWDLFRLGVIATAEHLTCAFGQYGLYNTRWAELGADPEMLDLVKWHGAEEIEHRTVAFDVYRHLGGGYIARYYLSYAVMLGTLVFWLDGAAHLMKQDVRFKQHQPSFFKPWIWKEWIKLSLQDNQILPTPIWMLKQQVSYLMPWYNPEQEASTADALAYIAQSRGALRAAA